MPPKPDTGLLEFSKPTPIDRFWLRFLIGLGLFSAVVVFLIARTELRAEPAMAAPLASTSNVCEPFEQVNDDAFGLGTGADGSYANEEGFEVAVFNNQLYIGMEADNSLGARLWRTKPGLVQPMSQADWEEVAADDNGYPFGVAVRAQADHIDSLTEFNGYLYVSTANGGSNTLGTRVFRSETGDADSWEDAIAAYGAGFGDVDNTNFKDMQVFQDWLCGGTQNWRKGAQVWCTQDGTTWAQKNVSGFGHNREDYTNREVWSGHVFNGALYFGVQDLGDDFSTWRDDVGRLFRTTDLAGEPKWTEVFTGAPGSYRADVLGDLDGYLYLSVFGESGIEIYRSPDGNISSWSQVNLPGMRDHPNNTGVIVDGSAIYKGVLYVGVTNKAEGFELWRTSGILQSESGMVDWKQVDISGLGDPNNLYTELISFNDYLYAWTSNYVTGQQVLRTGCSSEVSNGSTPTPTATPGIIPTLVPTSTVSPAPTPTETPVPTIECPLGDSNCQEPNVGSASITIFLPVTMRFTP